MTLKNLIQNVSWIEIEEKISSIYPEELESLQLYKRLYWDLYNLTPLENKTGEEIHFELFDEDDEVYYDDIEVMYGNSDWDEEECGLSLEQWKKYLGYFISPQLLEELDPSEVIAHTFIEATYGGFSEFESQIHHDDK